jgi:hypothetical protein
MSPIPRRARFEKQTWSGDILNPASQDILDLACRDILDIAYIIRPEDPSQGLEIIVRTAAKHYSNLDKVASGLVYQVAAGVCDLSHELEGKYPHSTLSEEVWEKGYRERLMQAAWDFDLAREQAEEEAADKHSENFPNE